MGSTLNSMPYEFQKHVKSVAAMVNAVQDEEITKVIAEEVSQEDPVDAEKIVEEAVNGTEKTRLHKKNNKESRPEV